MVGYSRSTRSLQGDQRALAVPGSCPGVYNDDGYRFEVPEYDFLWVLELLEENHYKRLN